jgi:Mn-dependent DtxR family transcriptional regulator
MPLNIKRPPPKVPTVRETRRVLRGELAPISESERKRQQVREDEFKKRARVPWPELKEMWILSHLKKKPMTLDQVAAEFKVSPQTVYNKSSEQGWSKELAFRMTNRDEIVASALTERSEQAIQVLQERFIADEVEIRKRHVLIARGLQVKAMARLRSFPVDKLKPMEALALLRLGLSEERAAAGIPDTYEKPDTPPEGSALGQYKDILSQFKDHDRIKEMGGELLRRLQKMGSVTDATILNSVGLGGDDS